jgi:hypothetical protein
LVGTRQAGRLAANYRQGEPITVAAPSGDPGQALSPQGKGDRLERKSDNLLSGHDRGLTDWNGGSSLAIPFDDFWTSAFPPAAAKRPIALSGSGDGSSLARATDPPVASMPARASASPKTPFVDDLAIPQVTATGGLHGILAPTLAAQQTTAVGDGTGADGADGPHGARIILHQDMVLERTWHLDSSTLLDCRGHRLTPRTLGTPETQEHEFRPSVPEVAIYVNAARGVTVQNCVLDGFDFGIEVANAKLPGDNRHHDELVNRFLRNTISGWFPIQVVGADDNLIEGNTLTYGQGARGGGVQIWADSDRNIIRNNTVLGRSIEENTRTPIFPGWRLGESRPDAVFLLVGTQVQSVINIIIDGRLQQILSDDVGRQDDNVVEGNYTDINNVSLLGRNIVSGENRFLRVEGNEIHRGWQGVLFSGTFLSMPFRLPGYCSRDPSRYGDDDGYCFIPGIDKEDLGPLVPGKLVTIEGGVEHGLIRGNRILGPFNGAGTTLDDATGPDAIHMAPNPLYPVIEDNEITGSARAGVRLGTNAIETAVVQRNVIHDNAYGVLLVAFAPPFYPLRFFGATISLNDVTASSRRAVGNSTTPLYDLPSELSDPGTLRGNYWGRTCDDGNGFRPFNPEDPDYGDSLRADILDRHAYGEPVAGRHHLPATCQ